MPMCNCTGACRRSPFVCAAGYSVQAQAITEGTVNATGDRIFVDGQWQPYTQRNGVDVNALTSRLNSANEQISALIGQRTKLEAQVLELEAAALDRMPSFDDLVDPPHTAGDVLEHALHARNRAGLPLP